MTRHFVHRAGGHPGAQETGHTRARQAPSWPAAGCVRRRTSQWVRSSTATPTRLPTTVSTPPVEEQPVDGDAARGLVLKLGASPVDAECEVAGLSAWAGRGTAVELVRHDLDRSALLLQRLDPTRDLARHPDAEEATAIVADLLARSRVAAPPGLRRFADEADRVVEAIEAQRVAKGDVVPAFAVDAALATWRGLRTLPDRWLLHFDAHYLNVLHTLAEAEDPGWRLIDPWSRSGPLEVEPTALLRNRFDDAAATGNPDRALLRRLDLLVERLDLDRSLARAIAHAVAVDNLLWLLPEQSSHAFVAPYRIIAGWIERPGARGG